MERRFSGGVSLTEGDVRRGLYRLPSIFLSLFEVTSQWVQIVLGLSALNGTLETLANRESLCILLQGISDRNAHTGLPK